MSKLDPVDEEILAQAKSAGYVFVTMDHVVRRACGGLSPKQAMEAGLASGEGTSEDRDIVKGMLKLSPEDLTMLGKEGVKTVNVLRQSVHVNKARAKLVRRLRVDEQYSWRAIARTCSILWGTNWKSNQLAGMVICEKAAKFYHGEDYLASPWNEEG